MTKKEITILLCEDDEHIVRPYVKRLSGCGYKVEVVFNGNEAIEKAVREPPTLIMLDLLMPVKTGYEVIETLKAHESTKHIPILVISNLNQDADIERARKLGADDYIVKSNVTMQELVERVQSHLPK